MRTPCVLSSLALLTACTSSSHAPAAHAAAQGSPQPTAVRAAPPSPLLAEARAQLESNDPAQIAWGAWNASSNRLTQLAPLVVRRLVTLRDEPFTKERGWVLNALGDAAIQLETRVPLPDLLEFARSGELRTISIVLAARAPAEYLPVLQHLYATADQDDELAVRNLLAAHAPEWIAPRLVSEVTIDVEVMVRDDTATECGSRSSVSRASGTVVVPPGFPPTVIYVLSHDRPRAVPLAAGPIDVGYERFVRRESRSNIGRSYDGSGGHAYALRLLRWMSGDRAGQGELRTESTLLHRWRDAETLLRATAEEVRARSMQWSALLAELERHGAIDRAVALTPAPISVKFVDGREQRDVDLPDLPR